MIEGGPGGDPESAFFDVSPIASGKEQPGERVPLVGCPGPHRLIAIAAGAQIAEEFLDLA